MEEQARVKFILNTVYYLIVLGGIWLICRFAFRYLAPFLVGAVIAFLVQKPAKMLSDKTKLKREVAAGILAVLIFLLTVAAVVFLGVKLIGAAGGLAADLSKKAPEITKYLRGMKTQIQQTFQKLPKPLLSATDKFYDNAVDRSLSALTSAVSSAAGSFATHLPLFLLSSVVALVSSCYMATDFVGLAGFVKGVIGGRVYDNLLKIKEIVVGSVWKFMKGFAVIMLINFVLLSVGFLVLKVKYAFLLAALVALADVLPVIGTGTVLIPWGIVCIVFSDYYRGVGLLVLYAVAVLVRNFAEPRVIGRQIGIAPLFTLIAMFIGLKLFGVAGVVLCPLVLLVVIEYYKRQMKNEEEPVS